MGANFEFFLYIPKCVLCTLETTFHGQKTSGLVGESLSWSETAYFHKGFSNGAKVASERNVRIFFFKQLYLGNLVTETSKVGLKLKIFAKTCEPNF